MTMLTRTRYWGFLDELGQITVCEYKNDRQIELCEAMAFIKGIFEPFESYDKVDAMRKCKIKLQEVNYHDKGLH